MLSTHSLYSTLFLPNNFSFYQKPIPNSNGLVAVGGSLSSDILIESYSMGIFPWYEKDPPLWYSPEQRMVLWPEQFHQNKSFARFIRKIKKENEWQITVDRSFYEVINFCAKVPRTNQKGTWINKSIVETYCELHQKGIVHSIETRKNNKLIGGIYGVSLGKGFFGESMFSLESNASKIALWALCQLLNAWEFHYIDCQLPCPHLENWGAKTISRKNFIELLKESNQFYTKNEKWTETAEKELDHLLKKNN